MGQRQNQSEIVYGDDCGVCFPAGETPKYVYARFSKLVGCPGAPHLPPNDRAFKLTQHDTRFCEYFYEINPWRVWFTFHYPATGRAWLSLLDENDWEYFDDLPASCPDEGKVLHNDIFDCGGPAAAHGGIAIVTWRLETLKIMGLLNIEVADDLFMEMRPLDDGSRVHKFCKLGDATNIAIKYNP